MPRQLPPPSWVIDDMIALSVVEPLLFPDPTDQQMMWHDTHPVSIAGGIYFQELAPALRACGARTFFIVPSVSAVQPHLAAHLAGRTGCAILTTQVEEAPPSTDPSVIPFGHATRLLDPEERLALLGQTLLNSGARCIHVIQSAPGWEVIRRCARQYKQLGMQIHATLLEEESTALGLQGGPVAEHFPLCSRYVDAVFIDMEHHAKALHHRDGFPMDRIFPLPFHASTPSPDPD